MSNKRIRYVKSGNGVLTSLRNFVSGDGQTLKVELDTTAKKYRILDATTLQELASGGNTRNISVLKIQAKKGLLSLGVQFSDEVRKRDDSDSINIDAAKVYSAANRGE